MSDPFDEMSVEEIDAYIDKIVFDAMQSWENMTPEQRAWEKESAFIHKVAEGLVGLIKLPWVYDVNADYDEETGEINFTCTTRFNHPIEIRAEYTFEG